MIGRVEASNGVTPNLHLTMQWVCVLVADLLNDLGDMRSVYLHGPLVHVHTPIPSIHTCTQAYIYLCYRSEI